MAGPGARRSFRYLLTPLLAIMGKLGKPLFWLLVVAFLAVPSCSALILSVSPRMFDQGTQWFTVSYLGQAFTGVTTVAMANSLWVSVAAAALGLAIGLPIAWLASRTTLPGRQFIAPSMWLVLLLPSWLPALGWQRLVQQDGVMYRLGLNLPWVTHAIMGPFGVVLLLGLRCVPFTFIAISAGLAGLGQEFEDAARVHGASRFAAMRLVLPMLAPAIWSAVAIGFAESISDFGVASTLAYNSNFNLATYQLYAYIANFPSNFPGASAMGLLLVAAVAIPLILQTRAMRGRSYQVLSGRTRQVSRLRFSAKGKAAAVAAAGLFYVVALGVPGFGAVSGSLLADFGGSFSLTLDNYRAMVHQSDRLGPLGRSMAYGVIAATVTVVGGFVAAWLLSQRQAGRARGSAWSSRLLDFMLLGTVALPSVVFAAGYIFAFNLPLWSSLGINLLPDGDPAGDRVLGLQPGDKRAGTHRSRSSAPAVAAGRRSHARCGTDRRMGPRRAVLPVVSRPLLMAWLLAFCAVFLELPISQLLYQPSSPPASVAIQDNLGNYHFGIGMAQSVVAVAVALVGVAIMLGGYRLIGPAGWRRIGAASRG